MSHTDKQTKACAELHSGSSATNVELIDDVKKMKIKLNSSRN